MAGHSASQREPGATRPQGHGPPRREGPGPAGAPAGPVGFPGTWNHSASKRLMEGCLKGPAVFSVAAETSPALIPGHPHGHGQGSQAPAPGEPASLCSSGMCLEHCLGHADLLMEAPARGCYSLSMWMKGLTVAEGLWGAEVSITHHPRLVLGLAKPCVSCGAPGHGSGLHRGLMAGEHFPCEWKMAGAFPSSFPASGSGRAAWAQMTME